MVPAEKIIEFLNLHGAELIIIPSNDEFFGEYTPESEKYLELCTGFSGSNGVAVLSLDALQQKSFSKTSAKESNNGDVAGSTVGHLLTDGRYISQAQSEAGDLLEIVLMTKEQNLLALLKEKYSDKKVGFFSHLHTRAQVDSFCKSGLTVVPLDLNAFRQHIKEYCIPRKKSVIQLYDIKYSGRNASEKLHELAEDLRLSILENSSASEHCKTEHSSTDGFYSQNSEDSWKGGNVKNSAVLITDPVSVCWLLNIRGNDVNYNRIVNCYLLYRLDKKDHVFLFGNFEDSNINLEIECSLLSIAELNTVLKTLDVLYCDTKNLNYNIHNVANNSAKKITCIKNPVPERKAIKNPTEVEWIEYAHICDAVSLVKLLYSLKCNTVIPRTERKVSQELLEYKNQNPDFLFPSFATICGFNENGAIIHYNPDKSFTEKQLNGVGKTELGTGVLLLDSGSQYKFATTDVTRTVLLNFGKNTSDTLSNAEKTKVSDVKRAFTLVLKGHISISSCKFPEGTTGEQIDCLARQFLWQDEKDYAHGTGHGVGASLCVHEGPFSISKRYTGVPLKAGMIVSIEPGHYKEDAYGIRIENLALIKNSTSKGWLEFEPLTLAPIDFELVEQKLLSDSEITWLVNYHKEIYSKISSLIEDNYKNFLQQHISFYENL